VVKPINAVNTATPIIIYSELNTYSKRRVSFKCSQFSLEPINRYKNIIIAGAEISSVKKTLLIFNFEKLFINYYYFQPAWSNTLTAALLFSPNVLIEIVSSLNWPQDETNSEDLTPANTGYS